MPPEEKKTKQAQVIDENLKRVYEDMLEESVPDRFLNLLDQLKQQDAAQGASGETPDE